MSNRVKNLFLFTSLAVLVAAAGCGKGRSSSPLTEVQRASFVEVNQSVGKSQQAAQNASRGVRFSDVPSTDEMVAALSNGSCDFTEPNVGGSSSGFGIDLSVSGQNCAITMRMKMGLQIDQSGSGAFTLDVAYKVNSDLYAKLNDVTAVEMKGGFKFAASATQSTVKGEITGSITSTKYGVIPVTMTMDGSGNQSGAEFEFELVWDFPEFDVVLLAKGSNSGNVYSLNGKEMTQSEFQALMAEGGPMFSKAFSTGS